MLRMRNTSVRNSSLLGAVEKVLISGGRPRCGTPLSTGKAMGFWPPTPLSQTIRERKRGIRDSMSDWNLLTGLPRSSMLLLGYAVEMYLKAGLAKAYKGCSEDMFERDVKGRFGHKLVSLAKEIVFPLKDDDEKNFILLQGMVLADARYPVFVPDGESYADTVNQQTEGFGTTRIMKLSLNWRIE